jgi:hypothetical protein
MADEQKKAGDETPKADPAAASPEQPKPAEALRQGFRLLWQAASSAADEIKREVQKGGVSHALQNAGRELESAATHAAKALDEIFSKVGPNPPAYQKKWPPDGGPDAKQVDADIPPDGGVDEKGERRDMRIQVDEKKPR